MGNACNVLLSSCKDFMGYTSAHGMPQIGAANNWPVRILWALIFFGGLGMFGYQLYDVVNTYLEYPVVVTQSISSEARFFPAITLCPTNPLSMNALTTNGHALANVIAFNTSFDPDTYWFNNMTREVESLLWAEEILAQEIVQMSDTELDTYTTSLDQMLVSCLFAGATCTSGDFARVRHSLYGYCYQINVEASTKYLVTRPGSDFGLSLLFKVNMSDTLPTTETSAFLVSVHQHETLPFPESFGKYAPAGYLSKFAVSKRVIVQQPDPYGNCTETEKGSSWSTWLYGDQAYTAEGCRKSCLQEKIIESCGCADPILYWDGTGKPDSAAWCGIGDSCVQKAMQRYFVVFSVDCMWTARQDSSFSVLYNCNCPMSCNRTQYPVVTSQSRLSSYAYGMFDCVFENRTNFQDGSTKKITTPREDCVREKVQPNVIGLDIFFASASSELFEEEPSYTFNTAVFALGGQIGLWLGSSVITVVEFVGFFLLLLVLCFQAKFGPEAISSEDKHENDLNAISDELEEKADIDTSTSLSSTDSETLEERAKRLRKKAKKAGKDSASAVNPYEDSDSSSDDSDSNAEPPPIA